MKYLSVCSGIEAAKGHVRDLTGHRNGRLVAIRLAHKKNGRAHWLCRCDYGGERVVQSNNLTRESGTKSCGCLRAEAQAARRKPASECPDGPRYKALGNSMAVPVMRWIGERIAAVDAIHARDEAA